MIGTTTRLISEEQLINTVCNSCKKQNTLLVRVYSKFFMLKILPFVYGKAMEIECTACKKVSENEFAFEAGTKLRIEAAKETAKHKWFLYLGYLLLGVMMVIALTKEHVSSS